MYNNNIIINIKIKLVICQNIKEKKDKMSK